MSREVDKWDLRYLHLAEHVAAWSKDPSTQTGAVLVDMDNKIVSLGYNGFPGGIADTQERLENRETKYELIIHCEMNAVLTAKRDVSFCTLYTWPFLSCPRCAVHMIQAGITRFVAPACPATKLDRWERPLKRTKEIFREAQVDYLEVDLRIRRATDSFTGLSFLGEFDG